MKTLKWYYLNIIQQSYGQGWEDVSEYEANSQGKSKEMTDKFTVSKNGVKRPISLLSHDLTEYKLMGYPTRVIFRKVLNTSPV